MRKRDRKFAVVVIDRECLRALDWTALNCTIVNQMSLVHSLHSFYPSISHSFSPFSSPSLSATCADNL